MRALGVIATVVTCSLVLFAGGCKDYKYHTADEIRAELARKHVFISEQEYRQDFVLTSVPGQIVRAHEYVYFTRDKVEWVFQEDLAESVDYQVDGEGNIEATGAWAGRVEGKYDADSGRLLWQGVWYQ
jgi:hypothetical protein